MTRPDSAAAAAPLTIRLQRIDDLFSPPEVTPFQADYHSLSGMDQIVSALKVAKTLDALQVQFVLPQRPPNPEALQAEVQAAIRRYCAVQIEIAGRERVASERATHRRLLIGTLILGASLGLSTGISAAEFLSESLRNLLSNSIGILGSVALWSPMDAFLYGTRPLQKTIRMYTAIQNLRFTIVYAA